MISHFSKWKFQQLIDENVRLSVKQCAEFHVQFLEQFGNNFVDFNELLRELRFWFRNSRKNFFHFRVVFRDFHNSNHKILNKTKIYAL
jgi:hypothetical protein